MSEDQGWMSRCCGLTIPANGMSRNGPTANNSTHHQHPRPWSSCAGDRGRVVWTGASIAGVCVVVVIAVFVLVAN